MNLFTHQNIIKFAGFALAVSALGGCDTGNTVSGTSGSTGGSSSTSSAADTRPVSTGAGNTASGDTIKIGLICSLTGANQPWGLDNKKGSQLAVDEFNKAGGLGGKKVDLIVMDDGSKPEQGKSAAEKLVGDEKVIAVIGEVASGIMLQIAPVCQNAGVPDVGVGATRDDISNIGNEVFRVCYTDSLQGPVMANFAYKIKGIHKVGIMTDKTQPYSTGLSKSFKDTFEKLGGQVVDEELYESGQTNFTGQLTNMKAKQPEGVFASGYFTEVGPMVRQAAEAGLTVPFFGGDGWDSSTLPQLGGKAIIGDYFCNHYSNDEKTPEVQQFLEKWKAAYGGEPANAMGALGYDAAGLTLDALKRAKGPDSKDLRDAIADTTDFKGVTGTITLKGQNGNPDKTPIIVQVTPNGAVFAKSMPASEVTR